MTLSGTGVAGCSGSVWTGSPSQPSMTRLPYLAKVTMIPAGVSSAVRMVSPSTPYLCIKSSTITIFDRLTSHGLIQVTLIPVLGVGFGEGIALLSPGLSSPSKFLKRTQQAPIKQADFEPASVFQGDEKDLSVVVLPHTHHMKHLPEPSYQIKVQVFTVHVLRVWPFPRDRHRTHGDPACSWHLCPFRAKRPRTVDLSSFNTIIVIFGVKFINL